MTAVSNVLNDRVGARVVSVILGLGLAAMFRTVCKGNTCRVVNSPPGEHMRDTYYKIDEDCYKYTPYEVPCDDK